MKIFSRRPFRNEASGEDDDALQVQVDDDERRPRWLPKPLGRREFVWAGLLLLLLVVAFGCWLGVRASEAKSNLEQARHSAQQAKDALLQGNTEQATHWADNARFHAQEARDATHSLPWNIASAVPWLGSPFKTGQQISDVVLGLAADVLQPSAHVGAVLAPDRLYADGRVDVQLLRDQEPQLSKISADASRLDADAGAISDPTYLSLLRDARSELQGQTSEIAKLAREHCSGRASRTVDDGRGWSAYILHGFPNQCRSPRHRWPARRIWNSSIRQRNSDRGYAGTEHRTHRGVRLPLISARNMLNNTGSPIHLPTSVTAIKAPTFHTLPKFGSPCGRSSRE